jgi:DNA modification methylase
MATKKERRRAERSRGSAASPLPGEAPSSRAEGSFELVEVVETAARRRHPPDELFPLGLNRLLLGDCLQVMRLLPSESVDLIYADPPFFSRRNHAADDAAEARSFSDVWEGGLPAYLAWLAARLSEMRRLLKPTGGIYVHLDWHASHYVKCEMDRLFGYESFRNEIFWRRDVAGKGAKRISGQWPRNADTILVYSKTEDWFFEQAYAELTPEQAANYRYREPDGRRFKTVQLGDYTEASIKRLEAEGRIYTSSTGRGYKKYYLDEARATLDTIWTDIPGFGTRTASSERLGYPTQKPEALLERIIRASCPKGGVVADFFCGSGTACAVAQKLGRRWLGCDISPAAIELASARLRRLLAPLLPDPGFTTERFRG